MKDDTLRKLMDREIRELGKKLRKGEIERNIESMNALNRLVNTRLRLTEQAGLNTDENEFPDVSPAGHPRGFMRSGAYKN